METLTTDGPPWHGDDIIPAADKPGWPRHVRAQKAPSPATGILPVVDRLAIGLTLFAAIGLLVGAQSASPSHSRELAPIMVTVPLR